MAEYQAKSNSTFSFDVTQGGKSIGKLSYKSWFQFNALIEMANNKNYQVEPKGFWGTTVELKDNEKLLLKFQMNWNGEIVIQTYFDAIEKGYVLKHKGFFKESFILADQEGTELFVMKPDLKWSKMSYEYQITTSDDFELFPAKEMLIMASIHCANYYMTMASGT